MGRLTTTLVIAGLVVAAATAARGQSSMTLAEAIATGKVSAHFTGMGASSGDAIRATVAQTAAAGGQTLRLTVPPGIVLRSATAGEQNMVIAGLRGRMVDRQRFIPQSEIVLGNAGPETYLLEAYCTEFAKGNPSGSTSFTVTSPDARLACILVEGKRRNLSTNAVQAAVWIVTDGVTRERMSATYPVSAADWSQAQEVASACRAHPSATRRP